MHRGQEVVIHCAGTLEDGSVFMDTWVGNNPLSITIDLEREYVSYFFASSQAMFCQKWIADGMSIRPKRLADIYQSVAHS